MEKFIKDTLGHEGRMISGSKSFYTKKHPNNFVLFNANLCVSEGKIWYGDLDVTKDKKKLIKIAKKAKETIYVLSEMDGRFENEESPLIDKYIVKFEADGTYEINEVYKEYYTL